MIVRERSNLFKLLLAWHGSVLPQILPQLVMVIGLSVVILLLDSTIAHALPAVPIAAFSLIGLTLSIFLVFRNNACFDRWWEARKLWGALIANIRHLDRSSVLLGESGRRQFMSLMLVFSYCLHARLRKTALTAILPQLKEWLTPQQYQHLAVHPNPPNYVLSLAHALLVQAVDNKQLSDICYSQLNSHVTEIGNVQAGCERILTTPLPFSYSLLLHRTAYLFCLLLPFGLASSVGWFSPVVVALLAYTFFGLDALGNELEDPFGLENNDLPLDAMVRNIEIDILSGLNAPDIPAPLQPVKQVLT